MGKTYIGLTRKFISEKDCIEKTNDLLANSVNKLVLFSMYIQALFTDRGTEISTSVFFNELENRETIVATYKVVASAKTVV